MSQANSMKAQNTFSQLTHPTEYFDAQSSQNLLLAQVTTRGRSDLQEGPPETVPGGALTVLGALTVAIVFFVSKRIQISQKTKSGSDSSAQILRSIPCSNCRFFSKNPYLKCTVHPQMAGKIEAKNCSDFWSTDKDEFHKKW